MEQYRRQTIFTGCSGGVDSMVLTHFLHEHQFNIHVLHVNYQKRGAESDGDMEFVQLFCKERNLPFDAKLYDDPGTGNFQLNARKFRYEFFEEFAAGNNGVIALAHHADDQVETFFMNLMRQSGIPGLASIPVQRQHYIRPLLHVPKEELIRYATEKGIKWREDQSNQSVEYLRNKCRLEFIPQMEKAVPELKRSALILIDAFQETQRELEQKTVPISSSILNDRKLSVDCYDSLSSEELFELWRQLHQPSNLFHRFLEIRSYPKGKYIETKDPFIKIIRESTYLSFIERTMDEVVSRLKTTRADALPQTFSKNEIYLNPAKIRGALKIRTWQQGDKLSPLGMKGTQFVSQIIRDAKVPFAERKKVLIVHDDTTIHWVVYLKVSRIAASRPGDDAILKVEIENYPN